MSAEKAARITEIWGIIASLEKQRDEGPVSDTTKEQINAKLEKLKTERARIELELQTEEQESIQQEHDIRVDGTVSAVDTDLNAIDFSGFKIRQLIPDNDDYLFVSIGFKQYVQTLADNFSQQIAVLQGANNDQKRSFEEREIQMQRQNDSLQQKLSKRELEFNDLETRFTAVANELAEVNQEKDSLKSQLATLQKIPQASTKTDAELQEENRQKEEAADRMRKERTIYDVQWVDEIKRNKKKAKLAATGEEIEFSWTVESRYHVIPESEVSQFREQYAIAITPEVPDMVEAPVQTDDTIEVPQFQTTTVTGPVPIPTNSSDGKVVEETTDEPITAAYFEQRLAETKAEILAELRGVA